MRRDLLILLTSASLLTLTGCGADGLSKEEFIAQGDAICTELDAQGQEIPAPEDESGFAPYLTQIAEVAGTARDDLAALDAPEDGQDVKDALVNALSTSITTIEGAAEAASGGDTVSAGDLIQQAAEEAATADEAAGEYGFQACAAGS